MSNISKRSCLERGHRYRSKEKGGDGDNRKEEKGGAGEADERSKRQDDGEGSMDRVGKESKGEKDEGRQNQSHHGPRCERGVRERRMHTLRNGV